MAQRKSKIDIIKNEKYMDDATSAIFFNLHKAAERKRNYIWATEKFSSLDSIWGHSNETKTSNILDDKRNETKVLKPEQEVLEQHSIDTKQYQVNDNNQTRTKMTNGACQTEASYKESQINVISPRPSLLGNVTDNKANTCFRYKSENSKQVTKMEDSDMEIPIPKANKISNGYKFSVHEENKEISETIFFAECGISNTDYMRNQENSHNQTKFRNPIKVSDPSTHMFGKNEMSAAATVENATYKKSSNGENEMENNCSNSKMQTQKVISLERRKRKHILSSSVNRLNPVQKDISEINNTLDMVQDSNTRSTFFKTMLILKIFKGDKNFEFLLNETEFRRIRNRFPKLQEVFPEINAEEKEIYYSVDAVKVAFGFLRGLRYEASDGRTAVEVLAALKSWEMYQYHAEFQKKFLKNLTGNNMNSAYTAAVHYGLTKICGAYKCAFSDTDLFNNDRPYRQRKCYISVSKYVEPREYCIPSKTVPSTLNDNFDKDITNEIVFKAIAGSYVITGFHILLNLDNERDYDSANLEFFYVVKNPQNYQEEQSKVYKPLRSTIVINLKKSLVVNQNETAEISIDTSIKPYLCLSVQENVISERCDEGLFSMNMTSTYKVENSNEKRFFIGKILYYPKT